MEQLHTTLSEPAVLELRVRGGAGPGQSGRDKERKRKNMVSRSQGVPLSLRKVSPALSIEPKWRRAECGVATNNEMHI